MRDDALVRIKERVEDQGLQRRVLVALRCGDVVDDRVEDLLDADACLGRGQHGIRRVEADDVLDLLLDALRVSARQVNLVDDRDNLEVVLERHVDVRERLRLDALRRIDDEQSALAGREAARDLIGEVDMARRIDEVELILLAVLALVVQPHCLRLDGDAALALDVHVVEDLRLHLTLRQRARILDQTVRNRRLAMVDVRDNREIADILILHNLLLLKT